MGQPDKQPAMVVSTVSAIDSLEDVAECEGWDFERTSECQVMVAVPKVWQLYTVYVSDSETDSTYMVLITLERECAPEQRSVLCELVNHINNHHFLGAFVYSEPDNMLMWRQLQCYNHAEDIGPEVLVRLIEEGVERFDQFYPAFMLVCFGGATAEAAYSKAIQNGVGRA